MCNVGHSGNKVPGYDIEASWFDHHARTWASWVHTAPMRQAVSCAIAVAPHGGAWHAAKAEIRAAHRATRAVPNASDPSQEDILPVPAAAA